MATIFDIQKNK